MSQAFNSKDSIFWMDLWSTEAGGALAENYIAPTKITPHKVIYFPFPLTHSTPCTESYPPKGLSCAGQERERSKKKHLSKI